MKITHNTPLAGYTSLKVGGPAETLIELGIDDDLNEALRQAADKPVWVLGYGTNCLISDKGLPGTVIINKSQKIEQLSPTRLKASSGTDWDDFVQFAISKGLYGLEFTSGIPGGVGAAIVGNIAAYGQQVADTFVESTMFNPADGSTKVWQKDALDFEYRTSALQKPENHSLVVLDAVFELSTTPTGELEYDSALRTGEGMGLKPDTLENRRKIIMEARRKSASLFTNPDKGPWTAGSFFKNPVVDESMVDKLVSYDEFGSTKEQILSQNKIHGGNSFRISAAHVLLAAGLQRGQTWGQVRLQADHVLKIENIGQATASELNAVVQEIITTVRDKLGITLVPEVRLLGKF